MLRFLFFSIIKKKKNQRVAFPVLSFSGISAQAQMKPETFSNNMQPKMCACFLFNHFTAHTQSTLYQGWCDDKCLSRTLYIYQWCALYLRTKKNKNKKYAHFLGYISWWYGEHNPQHIRLSGYIYTYLYQY